jgi:hypothetical protein
MGQKIQISMWQMLIGYLPLRLSDLSVARRILGF